MDPAHLATLRPSARNRIVGQTSHQSPQTLRAAASNLKPADYGHFLLHSLDLGVILPGLKHPYPKTRSLAIKALSRAWLESPAADTLQAIGGPVGLANILNGLTYDDATNLASNLGHWYFGPTDPRTQAIESLVRLLVPTLCKDGNTHPISRLGSTLVSRFIPAVNPSLIDELLHFVTKKDDSRLRRLLYNHPVYVADLLLVDYYKYENPELTFASTDLKWLFAQKSVPGSDMEIESAEHWGIQLFLKILSIPQPPWIVARLTIEHIFTFVSSALKNAETYDQYVKVLDGVIARAEIEKKAGNTVSFDTAQKMVMSIAHKMARAAEDQAKSRLDSLCDYIRRLGKVINNLDASVQDCLKHVAAPVRMVFLRSIHGLQEAESWKFPEDLKSISLAILPLFTRHEAELLLFQMDEHRTSQSNNSEFGMQINSLDGFLAAENQARNDAIKVAIRGRWAFTEGDVVIQKSIKEDLERWKILSHRQRKADQRVNYTSATLTIAAFIGDSLLLKETFAWFFERFLKDEDVRGEMFDKFLTDCAALLAGNHLNIEETASHGNEVLSLCIDALEKMRAEPSYAGYQFTPVYRYIRSVLSERLDTCHRFFIPESTAEATIAPLKFLFLRAEKSQLDAFEITQSYPVVLEEEWPSYEVGDQSGTSTGYNWSQYHYNTEKTRAKLSKGYRRVLIRFMDQLGQAREKMYAERRMQQETDAEQVQKEGKRFPWYYTIADCFLKGLPWEEDAPCLAEYLRQTILVPFDGKGRSKYEAYEGEWENALQLFSKSIPNNSLSRENALLPIIQHYRKSAVMSDGRQLDLSPLLTRIDSFMEAVHHSEGLLEAFYAPYDADSRASNPSGIDVLFGLGNPEDDKFWQDSNLDFLHHIANDFSYQDMVSNILPRGRFRGSHQLRRFFTILSVITWIHTLDGVSARDKGYAMVTDDNSSGLDFVTLCNNSELSRNLQHLDTQNNKCILTTGADTLSAEEIRNLINAIKTIVPLETTQDSAIRDMILSLLSYTDCPTLMEEDIFNLLADSDKSSLHRQFFTMRLLRVVSPEESKRLLGRFRQFVIDAQAIEPPKDVDPENPPKPAIKLTTVKYLIDTLRQPVTGLSAEEMTTEMVQLAKEKLHPSLQEALLTALINLLIQRSRIDIPSQFEGVWESISNLAIISISLDGQRALRESDWTAKELPTITFNNERPALLFNVQVARFPKEMRSRWALLIDRMLENQVNSTKRWLTEFYKRNNGTSEELEIVEGMDHGPLLNCLLDRVDGSYEMLWEYLPTNSWHIRILKDQLTSYLTAHKTDPIVGRLTQVDPNWRSTQNGQDFLSLRQLWSGNHDAALEKMVSLLVKQPIDDCAAALRAGLQGLLEPDAMFITPGNSARRSAPWEKLTALFWTLKPQNKTIKEYQENWQKNIRPIILSFHEQVKKASQIDERGSLLYDSLLCQVNLLALPFPFLELKQKDAHQSFANALFNIAMEVLRKPPPLLHLSKFLQQLLPQIIPLSGSSFDITNHLVEISEKRLDVDERLLGYSLVQACARDAKFKEDREQKEKIDELIRNLEDHEDESVRLLMLNVPDENASSGSRGDASVRGSGPGRGRVMRRGRGSKRGSRWA